MQLWSIFVRVKKSLMAAKTRDFSHELRLPDADIPFRSRTWLVGAAGTMLTDESGGRVAEAIAKANRRYRTFIST